MMHVEIYGGTDRGLQREHNEDAIRHAQFDQARISLALVADGVGGHAGGEIASRLAADVMDNYITSCVTQAVSGGGYSEHWLQQSLASAIQRANREIISGQQDTSLASMATTIVSILIKDQQLVLGYLGDSRCYRWRDGKLQQITQDQTLAQQMLDQGIINQKQYMVSPYHHVLSRALGLGEISTVDIHLHKILDGDIFLLCSDGLTNCLSDSSITEILISRSDITQATEELITCANDAGGVDNISVVLVKCEDRLVDLESSELPVVE
ncbi:MAG: protein phosphatase 2C domain-containing protein [Gammaproteobacteria bacterium]|nr:protein phosphatase 2C domain-containing protein [Gammaproteobacteria bacterium]